MNFTMANLMILSALLGSLALMLRSGARLPAIIALVAAGLEALTAFGLVSIKAPSSIGLVLAAALAVAGLWSLGRASTKPTVAAASVVALVGVIQLLLALEPVI